MSSKTARKLINQHPLQRLQSPSRGASALLHVLSLASFASSFHYLTITDNPINASYGWHFQFLTIIGLSLSTLSFTLGLLSDLTLSPTFFLLKNTLALAAAPLEVLISLLYWGLRAIDPKLVVPDWAPPLPFANDLQFHALPAVVLVLDLLFFSPPWTIAVVPAVGLSAAIAVAYYVWVEHCYAVNKFYPYPIFDEVGFEGRVGLFVGSAVVMAGTMVLLKWVYGAVNGREAGKARPGDVKKRA